LRANFLVAILERTPAASTTTPGESQMANVDATMMKVQRLLTGPMGLRISLQGETISITFTDSSTRINVSVQDWGTNKAGDPSALVRLSAPLLWEVEPKPELFEWIARQGGNYYFGHVVAYDDSSAAGKLFLSMSHTLLGDYLDEEELHWALFSMLGTADKLDDELKEKFGGKRYADYT
jgi:hypothetical protein